MYVGLLYEGNGGTARVEGHVAKPVYDDAVDQVDGLPRSLNGTLEHCGFGFADEMNGR